MKCLVRNNLCKFWNEIIGCDDYSNICKCYAKETENEKLKENLQKCNPFDKNGFCGFCMNNKPFEHLDDCEYIKLCGEDKIHD